MPMFIYECRQCYIMACRRCRRHRLWNVDDSTNSHRSQHNRPLQGAWQHDSAWEDVSRARGSAIVELPIHINKGFGSSLSIVRKPVNLLYSMCPARIRDRMNKSSPSIQWAWNILIGCWRSSVLLLCGFPSDKYDLGSVRSLALEIWPLNLGARQWAERMGSSKPITRHVENLDGLRDDCWRDR
jgi:hypothetical protein